MSTDAFNLWSIVLQAAVWLAMIATFVVYHRQLAAMRDAARGQNILSLINFLQSDDVREARRVVRTDLRSRPFKNWSDVEQQAATRVCSTYDVAGILILQQRLVPADVFIDNWGPSIRDCYRILEPYIREMQKDENSGPQYWNDFDALFEACSLAEDTK